MRIAITRLEDKAGSDPERCRVHGYECYPVTPLTATIRKEEITRFVDSVTEGLFDCIFFTSALPAQVIAPLLPQYPRVIAIGPQTARELEKSNIKSEILPRHYSSEFVPYLGDWIRGKRIGIPRAAVPNRALIKSITGAGAFVTEFHCYELKPSGKDLDLAKADAILFTSAMSFTEARWKSRRDLLVMAIGEVTAGVMIERGTIPDVIGDGSLEGTLKSLDVYLGRGRQEQM